MQTPEYKLQGFLFTLNAIELTSDALLLTGTVRMIQSKQIIV